MKKEGKNIAEKRPQLGVPFGMKNKGSGRGMLKADLKVFETFFYPAQVPVSNEI